MKLLGIINKTCIHWWDKWLEQKSQQSNGPYKSNEPTSRQVSGYTRFLRQMHSNNKGLQWIMWRICLFTRRNCVQTMIKQQYPKAGFYWTVSAQLMYSPIRNCTHLSGNLNVYLHYTAMLEKLLWLRNATWRAMEKCGTNQTLLPTSYPYTTYRKIIGLCTTVPMELVYGA